MRVEEEVSRRDALRAIGFIGATVTMGATLPTFAQDGPGHKSPDQFVDWSYPQGAGFYRTHIGEFEITLVSDGSFPLAPVFPTFGANATEAQVNAVLEEAFLSPKSLMGQVNVVLVKRSGAPLTLIDTGCGKAFGPATGFAITNLTTAGVKPEQIEQLVLTHLHPDHIGGALSADGKLAFPNAKIRVHQAEIDFWSAANPDFSKSGVPEEGRAGMIAAAKKFLEVAGKKIEPFSGETTELLPRLTVLHTGGHTPGHCTMQFEDGGERLTYLTDLTIQSVLSFRHPEWWTAFDTDREKTADIRRATLAKLAGDRTMVSGSHLPFPSLGHVRKMADGFEYVPAPWKWA